MGSSEEQIYSDLMRNTLEMVCRMAGPGLAYHAVSVVQEKYKEKIELKYDRYGASIELKGVPKDKKVELLQAAFRDILAYIRNVIGESILIYAEKGVESVKKEAEKQKVELPKIRGN